MKIKTSLVFLLIPIAALAAHPPPPGLPDEPVPMPIDSNIFLLGIAAMVLAGYTILKKK